MEFLFRRSTRRMAIRWAAVGFAVAVALTTLDLASLDLASRLVGLYALCPSSLMLMASEGMSRAELAMLFAQLILANTFLYGLAGLVFGWFWHRAVRPADSAERRTRFGRVFAVAVGFCIAGFLAMFVAHLLSTVSTRVPAGAYWVLNPVSVGLMGPGHHFAALLATVVYGPLNAAVYTAVGGLAGWVWVATHSG